MKLCFGRSFSINNENDLRVMAKILWRLWEEQDRCFEILGYRPIRLFGQRDLNGTVQPRRLYRGNGGKLEKILLPRKWGITHEMGIIDEEIAAGPSKEVVT